MLLTHITPAIHKEKWNGLWDDKGESCIWDSHRQLYHGFLALLIAWYSAIFLLQWCSQKSLKSCAIFFFFKKGRKKVTHFKLSFKNTEWALSKGLPVLFSPIPQFLWHMSFTTWHIYIQSKYLKLFFKVILMDISKWSFKETIWKKSLTVFSSSYNTLRVVLNNWLQKILRLQTSLHHTKNREDVAFLIGLEPLREQSFCQFALSNGEPYVWILFFS